MKQMAAVLIIVLLLIFICYLFFDKQNRIKELEQAEKQIKEYEKQYQDVLASVNNLQKINIELQAKQNEKEKKISELEAAIREKNKKIDELEKERPETPPGCEEIVAHYLKEIEAWKEQFSLAQKQIDEQKALIFVLNLRLANQDEQIRLLQSQLDKANSVIETQKNIISSLEKSYQVSIFSGKIKTAGLAILGGILIYDLVRR